MRALEERRSLPFVRRDHGLSVLFLAGERSYVIDHCAEAPARRAQLVERDGLDRALLCLSSPLGIESLPREESLELIDAYHEGAFSVGDPFGVWGAIALDEPDPDDIDLAIERGCVGISLPAGALASFERVARLHPLLARLESLGAPLLVHPGPGRCVGASQPALVEASLCDPLWWPALNRYVADMHSAWHAFLGAGRAQHPRLRVVFTMLAGLAPLHAERLSSRGGPGAGVHDPLVFYDTSSYGPTAVSALAEVVGAQQILYGSDRPVVEPAELGMPGILDWELIDDVTRHAIGEPRAVALR